VSNNLATNVVSDYTALVTGKRGKGSSNKRQLLIHSCKYQIIGWKAPEGGLKSESAAFLHLCRPRLLGDSTYMVYLKSSLIIMTTHPPLLSLLV
jgi:hypothetical protein